MSLMSLLVNDWLPIALFGVVCCAVLAVVGCCGFKDGNGLTLDMALLFFAVFFFALSVG
jgi:hypothetical protein